jgi:hypothetical protein
VIDRYGALRSDMARSASKGGPRDAVIEPRELGSDRRFCFHIDHRGRVVFDCLC